jgi:hypothetical protein
MTSATQIYEPNRIGVPCKLVPLSGTHSLALAVDKGKAEGRFGDDGGTGANALGQLNELTIETADSGGVFWPTTNRNLRDSYSRYSSIKGSLRQSGIFADVHFVELDQLGF